jgi:serine/threonine protein kinase
VRYLQVLRNPHTQLQESKSVDLAMLEAKQVKPYTTAVDIWAVGVLAYELVCGRPPFEVDDEAQTAALIMYSDNIKFPPQFSAQWADFVRNALIKKPETRPSATELLDHTWCGPARCHSNSHLANLPQLPLMLPYPAPTQGPRRAQQRLHVPCMAFEAAYVMQPYGACPRMTVQCRTHQSVL